jgi:acetyl esterase/lipase
MKIFLTLCLALVIADAFAQKEDYITKNNIHYYSDSTNKANKYIDERCVLDLYYPKTVTGFPTIVWFHGGGLTVGDKYIPQELKDKQCAIVAVNYRLYPGTKVPGIIADAAAAYAWTLKNIEKFGGDPKLVFIAGHSAGGYLASMVALDKKWLLKYQIDANNIAGIIPVSGQAITHFIIRKDKGIPMEQPVIDEFAPLYHVRADASPMLLITGGRELEVAGRYEENAYMASMMKLNGHKNTILLELDGYDHVGMEAPAHPLLLKFVNEVVRQMKK